MRKSVLITVCEIIVRTRCLARATLADHHESKVGRPARGNAVALIREIRNAFMLAETTYR